MARASEDSRRARIALQGYAPVLALLAGAAVALPAKVGLAACTLSGSTYTCTGTTTNSSGFGVGAGRNDNSKTLNVDTGAIISTTNFSAISLGNGNTINVGANAQVTTTAGGTSINGGSFGTGPNTIEFGANSAVTIGTGATVTATGGNINAEAINVHGFGNTITNNGTIFSNNSSAIFLQNDSSIGGSFVTVPGVSGSFSNVILNFGLIEAAEGPTSARIHQAVAATPGQDAPIFFANEVGATVLGDLNLGSGNDTVELLPRSTITGNLNGGGGSDTLILNADAGDRDQFTGQVQNFETLTKTGLGQWEITGALSNTGGSLAVDVNQGTLVLSDNNTGFVGTMTVDSAGILQLGNGGASGGINSNILDNGAVVFDRSDSATFANVISGTGVVEQSGTGTTTLTGVNTYSGGTIINSGALAAGADTALGNAAGGLTFNGGTFRFNQSFDLAATRPITIQAPGGTIDTQEFSSTIAQGITGAGALTKTGSGSLTLNANNTHQGGTTVAEGELIVGDAAHAGAALSGSGPVGINAGATLGGYGSVTGNVTNNGTLAVANALPAFNAGPSGNFTVNGTLTNNGVIAVGGADTAPANRLVVNGNYIGNNGRMVLNTFLDTDGSPSDRLVINGGTAPDGTGLTIQNVGGPGAPTLANGIMVVQTTGGGTTAPGAFTLDGEARAGAFDYFLFRGGLNGSNPQDWFLRSDFTVPPGPGEPPTVTPPPTEFPDDPPPSPLPPGTYPIIGPEIATYGVVQPIARQMGRETLGTLHERIGERLTGDGDADAGSDPAWGRVIGEQIDNHYHAFADPGASGRLIGVQAGLDLWRGSVIANHRDVTGLYFAYANSHVDVDGLVTNPTATGYMQTHTGAVDLNSYSLGGYWTHYGPGGWYLDAVLQGSFYDGNAKTQFADLQTVGRGVLTSLEAGYPIPLPLGPRFVLEPQAQVFWQHIAFDRTNDSEGPVDLGSTSGETGRLGLRGQWTISSEDGTVWQPYARANVWRDWDGRATANFGVDQVPLLDQSTRLEFAGGLTTRLNGSLSFYVQAGYEFEVGNSDNSRRDGVKGDLGLRYTW